jgi:Ca2+-binding EF-hand superfamily protein
MDAFSMIDLNGKSWVTAPDLRNSLEDYGFYPHVHDVLLFVRRYDRDSDGRVLYSDFCEAFCPKDPLSAGVLNQREAVYLH